MTLATAIALRILESEAQKPDAAPHIGYAVDALKRNEPSDQPISDDTSLRAAVEQLHAIALTPALKRLLSEGITLHTAVIEHRHGVNHYAALTDESLKSELASFTTEYQHELPADAREAHAAATTDDERVSIYFEDHPRESVSMDETTLPPLSSLLDEHE